MDLYTKLTKSKTLYKFEIDYKPFKKKLKLNYPHLFEMPKWYPRAPRGLKITGK